MDNALGLLGDRFQKCMDYSPGFIGDGWKCVDQLLQAHPDKFIKSNEPAVGAVFSCIGRNHVGIVLVGMEKI